MVGFVGRLAVDKGVPELIEATERARQAEPRLRLLLVGPLEDVDALGVQVQRLQASDWAVVTGALTDPLAAYWAADVFCLPSHREGFPISPLEAQACGLPVITTTATGCIDSIAPGETGVAVESGSVGQLQAAIMSLATDPESARRMGAESRARVVAQFDQVDVRARFVDYVTGLQR